MVVYIEDVDDVCMIPKLCCYWLLLFEFVSCDDIIRYFMTSKCLVVSTACYRMLSQDLDLCSIHDVISRKISRVSIQSIVESFMSHTTR